MPVPYSHLLPHERALLLAKLRVRNASENAAITMGMRCFAAATSPVFIRHDYAALPYDERVRWELKAAAEKASTP